MNAAVSKLDSVASGFLLQIDVMSQGRAGESRTNIERLVWFGHSDVAPTNI